MRLWRSGMGNCKDCKHWTPPEPSTKAFNAEGFGVCGLGHGLAWQYGPVSHGQTLSTEELRSVLLDIVRELNKRDIEVEIGYTPTHVVVLDPRTARIGETNGS
jgi:hypothetical protein